MTWSPNTLATCDGEPQPWKHQQSAWLSATLLLPREEGLASAEARLQASGSWELGRVIHLGAEVPMAAGN